MFVRWIREERYLANRLTASKTYSMNGWRDEDGRGQGVVESKLDWAGLEGGKRHNVMPISGCRERTASFFASFPSLLLSDNLRHIAVYGPVC